MEGEVGNPGDWHKSWRELQLSCSRLYGFTCSTVHCPALTVYALSSFQSLHREKDGGIGERAGSYFCPYLWGGRRQCLASGEGSYHSPTLSCSRKEVRIASALSSTDRNYPHY
jgi:hypothetical protein